MANKARGHRSREYAVYENIEETVEYGVSLEEAFDAILKRCRYEPIWKEDGETLFLQFQYLDGPYAGQRVGEQPPIPLPEQFDAVMRFGDYAARKQIMTKVCAAGLRGWYATSLEGYDTLLAQSRAASTRPALSVVSTND